MNNNKMILNVIENAVMTIPGISSFAKVEPSTDESLATKDINKAIEFNNTDKFARFRIHVVLINSVNIRSILNEVQIRVKYELEKMSRFTVDYLVDVVVDDMLLN